MKEITVKVHTIAEDGLPDMDALLGRVTFIFDGAQVSGWPLGRDDLSPEAQVDADMLDGPVWEADSDVGTTRPLGGVTKWIEWPEPMWDIEMSPISSEAS